VVVSSFPYQSGRTLAAALLAGLVLCGVQFASLGPLPTPCRAASVACPSQNQNEISGIGVLFVSDIENGGRLTVVQTVAGAPAERMGIVAGDVLEAINGQDAGRIQPEVAAGLLRGESGTTVEVGVFRPSSQDRFTVEITRARFVATCQP